jgi:hypothetical protein
MIFIDINKNLSSAREKFSMKLMEDLMEFHGERDFKSEMVKGLIK